VKAKSSKLKVESKWKAMRTLVTLGLTLIVTAAILAQAPAPAGDARNGRKLFAADGCYQCHGYEAQGATPTGPRLGPKPIAFAQFSKYVRQPTGQMPPYTTKSIPDKDLTDIYAFLQSLPAPPDASSIPALR
jgi:ubiquinol-cytochrome c reductase cytochrome c subunit